MATRTSTSCSGSAPTDVEEMGTMTQPAVGRYGGSHRASNDRPQLSAERSGVTAAAAPTAPARLISATGGGHCAQSLVAWRAMPSYDGASRGSSCSSGLLRQYLPRGTDLSRFSQAYLNRIALRLNQRPRKTLGFETPADRLRAVLQ